MSAWACSSCRRGALGGQAGQPGLGVHIPGGDILRLLVLVGHAAGLGSGGQKALVAVLGHPQSQADAPGAVGVGVLAAGFHIAVRVRKGRIQCRTGGIVIPGLQREIGSIDDLALSAGAGGSIALRFAGGSAGNRRWQCLLTGCRPLR